MPDALPNTHATASWLGRQMLIIVPKSLQKNIIYYVYFTSFHTVRHWARLCSTSDQIRNAIDATTYNNGSQQLICRSYMLQTANTASVYLTVEPPTAENF